MGSGASRGGGGGLSRHHRENEKNRLNPTEKVDKWKEKMLLDIGTDPLSVIRDFPRMDVFFLFSAEEKSRLIKERGYMSYVVKDEDTEDDAKDGGASWRGRNAEETAVPVSATKKARNEALPSDTHSTRRPSGERTGRDEDGGPRARSNPLTPMGNLHRGSAPDAWGHAAGQDHKLLMARRHRLKRNVLKLAELVGERDTFGRWFEETWEEKEREFNSSSIHSNSHTHNTQSTAAYHTGDVSRATSTGVYPSESSRQLNSRSSPLLAKAGSSNLASGSTAHLHHNNNSTANGGRESGPDIHQLFQAVCIECGMLNVTYESAEGSAVNTSAVTTAAEGSGTKRANRLPPRGTSALFSPSPATAVPGDVRSGGAVADTTGVMHARSASQLNVNSSGKTSYAVASATFHAMQFIVQGVMFFPAQRLKHFLWFPWAPSPLYSDCDWKVFVFMKTDVKSVSEFIYGKKIEHAAHKRSIVGGGAAADASHPNPDEGGNAEGVNAATAGRATKDNRRRGSDTAAAAEASESTPLLSCEATREGSTARFGATADLSRSPSANSKAFLVIKHLQTVQHFVGESDRKKVPKYQLDYTCTMYIDTDQLDKTYRPFLGPQRQRWQARQRQQQRTEGAPTEREDELEMQMDTNIPSLVDGVGQDENEESQSISNEPPGTEDHAPFASAPEGDSRSLRQKTSRGPSRHATATASGRPPAHGQSSGTHVDARSATAVATEGQLARFNSSRASGKDAAAAVGVRAEEQQRLVAQEVVFANMDVVGARVERAKKGLCGVPSKWLKSTNELRFVLEEQYQVELEEVNELKRGRH